MATAVRIAAGRLLIAAAVGAVVGAGLGALLYQAIGGKASQEPAAFVGMLANAGLLGAAVFAAIPLLQQAVSSSAAAEANRGSVDLQAIAEVLYGDWIAGKFNEGERLRLFGHTVNSIREGRAYILSDLRTKGRESGNDPSVVQGWWDEWELATKYQRFSGPPGPEAQFCYHIADKLDFVGLMCFAGAIPLRVVLAGMANLIVEDWALSLHWVTTYTAYVGMFGEVQKGGEQTERVYFHRRHAEWLALIAIIWTQRYFSNLDILDPLAPESFRAATPESLSHRVLALSRATGSIMLPSVARDLRNLIGIDV